jgi:tetratricopeptide (TPR) repeat protein
MTNIHITRELLEAVSRGAVPERFLSEAGMQHLTSLCPFCREEIREWEAKRAARPEYDYVLQALPAVLGRHVPELEARWRRAEEDLAALLAIPREERRARIERARSRFRDPYMAELLIQESRRRTPEDSEEADHLAELARFIIHRSPGTPESFDLVALATASMANACRAGGDLRQTEEHFQYTRYVITHQGVTAPGIIAQIDSLEGSLRIDQRRFPQAEALLIRAAMFCRISGAAGETAGILLKLGTMYFQQGDLGRAVETTRAALEALQDGADLLRAGLSTGRPRPRFCCSRRPPGGWR